MGKEETERKGKWWRDYTKQHLEGKNKQKPAQTQAPIQPRIQRPAAQPFQPRRTQVFQIKIPVPPQPAQPQKLTPYRKLKRWLGRRIGKVFFGLAFAIMGRMLKKQARERQARKT